MEENNFLVGGLCGFIAAGCLGVILTQMRVARTKMGLKDKAMDNFPDAAQPKLTPSSVVNTSHQAGLELMFWFVILIILIGVMVAGVNHFVLGG